MSPHVAAEAGEHFTPSAIARFNAWFFDTFEGLLDWLLRGMKRDVFIDLPGTIVEIGPGAGANFRYYRPGTKVIAVEPNPAMHRRLAAKARARGVDLVIVPASAEETGLAAGSFPAVVSSLVLCTVDDPVAAIGEARRILEPGGRLLAVEHVRARSRALRLVQRIVSRPWSWVFDGCHLDRDTSALIAAGGFRRHQLTDRTLMSPVLPFNSFVYGEAVK